MLHLKRSTLCSAVRHVIVLFLPIILGFLLTSCSTNVEPATGWQKEGLEGTQINEIITSPSFGLAIASNKGMFMHQGGRIHPIGLQNKVVLDAVFTGDNGILAGIPSSGDTGDTTLYKTVNPGDSWQPFMGNYGGESEYPWVYALEAHPEEPQHLFARGSLNVSQSLDGGQTWTSIFKSWGAISSNASLLKIDPNNPDIIWAGGANFVYQPYVVRSKDGGGSWEVLRKNLQIFEDLYYESTVYSIAIKSNRSSHLLLGLGAGIFRSTNGGDKWESVYSGISGRTQTHSARDDQTIYASGVNGQGTLFFVQTKDFGDTWEMVEMEDGPSEVRVNDMISVMVNGREVLYFGTNQGVYSYTFGE